MRRASIAKSGRSLFWRISCFCAALFGAPQTLQAWSVSTAGQAPILFSGNGASELSGIAYAGDKRFYAVSDDGGRLFALDIDIDRVTGEIVETIVGSSLVLPPGYDLEGVALPGGNSVLVSDEKGPAIRRHALSDGALQQTALLPSVFASHRTNLSLESLSLQSGGAALWTCNEETLSVDGPLASFTAGATVRLQRFDANLTPTGQWAYVTDPIPGDLLAPGRDIEASGVSDLVALPNGDLIVLERALGLFTAFRNRLYAVDFAAASDTSTLATLASGGFTAVAKTLLWEESFSQQNFEGAALGPRLANGDHSLLLVSDDGNNLDQDVYALRLSLCDPAPRNGCRASQISRFRLRSTGNKSRLQWSWRRGTVSDTQTFGTPMTTTPYTLCVYDSVAGAARLAASARVEPGSAWRVLRSGTQRYRDRAASADGVSSITLKPGDGTARVVVNARGANLHVVPANVTQPLLRLEPRVVVQLIKEEAGGECFEAAYATVATEKPDRFAASFTVK